MENSIILSQGELSAEQLVFYIRLKTDFNVLFPCGFDDYIASYGHTTHHLVNCVYISEMKLIPGSETIKLLNMFGFDSKDYDNCLLVSMNLNNAAIIPNGYMVFGLADKDRMLLLDLTSNEVYLMPMTSRCGLEYQYGEIIIASNFDHFLRNIHLKLDGNVEKKNVFDLLYNCQIKFENFIMPKLLKLQAWFKKGKTEE